MLDTHFEFQIRVYSEDVDHMGIVYHANHLKFYERARAELMRTTGFSLLDLKRQGIQFAIYDVKINYLKPARLDDMITIHTICHKRRSTALSFKQKMINQSGVHISDAAIGVVCVNDQMKPSRLPKSFNTK